MMQVHALRTEEAFQRYAQFAHHVYRQNAYWIPPDDAHRISLLSGESATTSDSQVQAFWVEDGDEILATLTAVVDQSYNRYWNEALGHLFFFEALPGCDEEVQALFQDAIEWLRTRGCTAVRASLLPAWQLPFAVDAYDSVPTFLHTYNPPYYHSYVKNAGFSTKRGAAQYQVEFTPELARGYQQMVDRAAGERVGLRSWDLDHLEQEITIFTKLLNETFSAQWGSPQYTLPQIQEFIMGLRDFLVADFTGFAEVDGQPAGFVLSLPDVNQAIHQMKQHAAPEDPAEFARRLQEIDHGVLLIIGVQEQYRGRGIGLALAAKSYLAMIERRYKTGSYTVVLDDNRPSRRTAEKMGARAIRNFVIYEQEIV